MCVHGIPPAGGLLQAIVNAVTAIARQSDDPAEKHGSGGGIRLANWLYNVGRRDGTAIGAVARAMAFEPLLGNKGAQYDGTKFNYIGSTNDEVSVCVAWYTSAASCRALVE